MWVPKYLSSPLLPGVQTNVKNFSRFILWIFFYEITKIIFQNLLIFE